MRALRYGPGHTRRVPSKVRGEDRDIAKGRSPGRIRAGLVASALTILSSVVVSAPVAAAPAPVPRVVIVVGPSGAATDRYRAAGSGGGGRGPPLHGGCHRALLPERHLAGRAARPARRQRRHLHGPRQRLAQPIPRQPVPAHAERLRAQSEPGWQRLQAPVLRRGGRRLAGPPGHGRRRPAQPPLLRERQLGARRGGRHDRYGQAPSRQLRGRVHQGGRVRRARRRIRQPERVPRLDPGRTPIDRLDLAPRFQRERQRLRLRQPAESGLHRPDGSREADVRLHALDRPARGSDAGGRSRRRARDSAPGRAIRPGGRAGRPDHSEPRRRARSDSVRRTSPRDRRPAASCVSACRSSPRPACPLLDGLQASVRWDVIELLTPPAAPPTPGSSPAPEAPVEGLPG